MPITFIEASNTSSGSSGSIELNAPSSIVDGDLLVAVGMAADNVAIEIDEVGFAEQANVINSTAADSSIVAAVKIASSESGTYTLNVEGVSSESMQGWILQYRGVDQSTPIDAVATTVANTTNSTTHNPAAITTVTDGAWVISICAGVQCDVSATEPTGYTLREEKGETTGFDRYLGTADKAVVSAGVEDPGNWTDLPSTADTGSITIAIRPAAGASANPKGPLGMPLHGPFGGPLGIVGLGLGMFRSKGSILVPKNKKIFIPKLRLAA